MTKEEAKVLAEEHWEYTKKVSVISGADTTAREHFFYVQAFIHGLKHGEKERKQ